MYYSIYIIFIKYFFHFFKITYKCDDIYNHEAEGGLKFDDPDVGVEWPMGDLKKEDLITSEKDAKWPSLKELKQTDLFKNIKGEN